MHDEHDDRMHQALRHDFAANIASLVESIAYAFDRLHARLYGAPWISEPDRRRGKRATRFTTL